ncbi:hypothetical protein P5G50_12690 [Leifsonia sp. F6_8S_P_1B]|uniref:Uncharacterized protein n=1 Tax=Leifsonia williamsii TaxID=3035919 RepID=A0ABT8KCW6_9MICO|nr:hypothetical protein [Leifsonia williamsii]MDN4615304.1 hypothetical protein [Leifsonia williamsii]
MKTRTRFVRLGLEVLEISEREWRISDTAVMSLGEPPVRGFIRALDSMFEVTEIGRPGRRTYYRDFDAALRELRH